MTNEEMLQNVINTIIERIGRQTVTYESEIANLNAQVSLHQSKIEELQAELQKIEKKAAKAKQEDPED